jgi:hypothetical protein
MFPTRGDRKSAAIVALATVCDAAFWFLAIWAPIAIVILSLNFRQLALTLIIPVCAVAALIARALGKGIFSGRRAAYIGISLTMLGPAALHIAIACVTTSSTAILAASRAVVYICLALFAATLAIRSGAPRNA